MICSSLHFHRKSPYCSLNVFPEEGVISQRVSPQQPGKESPLSSMRGHKVGFASSQCSLTALAGVKENKTWLNIEGSQPKPSS